ncbi:MAG: family 43 glycosylhydrolase [Sedimentisphaerales bacterium]|nr:family 43 glycosylhydrolase [Sedimentisphaerales bacterium]
MSAQEITAGVKSHDRALFLRNDWIRDPYIILGPDNHYYLTGTTPDENDPRELSDPYNIGLGNDSIVGKQVRLWRSEDLANWEYLGVIFTLEDSAHYKDGNSTLHQQPQEKWNLWAPELHWLGDKWALVHCPGNVASLALTQNADIKGPWAHPMGINFIDKHDPSLFQDSDGSWWLLWLNTLIAPISHDLTKFTAEPVRIDPSGSRPDPLNESKELSRIGHEGATMLKIGNKYVHLGTAWSTDKMRKGSYNLYYCTSDNITGPYGPRRFAGRFLGHGTPFKDKDGKWWCTAFFNGNVPPLPQDGIEKRDLSKTAQTINQRGTTIVPLQVDLSPDGDVYIRAKDPAYATPGPDERQKF